MRWLSRFVEDVRVLELPPGGSRAVDLIPDGRASLVIRSFGPAGADGGDAWVFGQRTRAHFKTASGYARAVVVQFKPGWSGPLLGVAADTLTDQIVSLADMWRDGRAISDSLISAETVPVMLDRLSDAIASRAADESASAHLARRAVRMFEGEEMRVDRVAKQLGVTARHLRRAFVESVGVGPKEFVRSVRLQRALQRTATSSDWGRIASDVGYYDQAHLISDFRDMIGLTPGAYLARLRTATPY